MKYRIVHVRWHDSCLESEEWEPRREAIKLARTTKDQLIDSVGIVIDDNRYALVITQDHDPVADLVKTTSSIPKSAIRSIRTLGYI